MAKVQTTSSTDARTASRARCAGFYVTSLSFNKEVTKKVNPDEPLGASLSVPRCIANQGEKHERFSYIARHFATTRGRRRKQGFFVKNLVEPRCVESSKSLCIGIWRALP